MDYPFRISEKKVIIRIKNRICDTSEELLASELFRWVLDRFVGELSSRNSMLMNIFGSKKASKKDITVLIQSFQFLIKMPFKLVPSVVPDSKVFFRDPELLSDFVENLYNYWRGFSRFIICDSPEDTIDQRPYRTFNETVEKLMHLVRWTYRSIEENITGDHPRIYRQISAGAEIAAIAVQKKLKYPKEIASKLNTISVIRQVLLYPPLVINPPMNKRTGEFERVTQNPLDSITLNKNEWLCYPAKVGPLLIAIYFHEKFYELGFALSNLFELADDKDLNRSPDGIYFFGVSAGSVKGFEKYPSVFYDNEKTGDLIAAIPNGNEFGYFGYLKKMVLTLHNIKMMKLGKMPFHGALVRIVLKGNKDVTILIVGDTGAGKSETLEALRQLGKEYIQDMVIIADDMGSLEISRNGDIIGYGTEIGAFLRLDDLQPGFAFGQMDRSIIMSAHMTNARIVIPVTTYQNVVKGHAVDVILYANNFETVDKDYPIIEKFETAEKAFDVFRAGVVMSKGTTTSTGLVRSYFANIFGPPQYKDMHEKIAEKYFKAFFKKNIFVGQIRTRLGIAGLEAIGPREAAENLLKKILQLPKLK